MASAGFIMKFGVDGSFLWGATKGLQDVTTQTNTRVTSMALEDNLLQLLSIAFDSALGKTVYMLESVLSQSGESSRNFSRATSTNQ